MMSSSHPKLMRKYGVYDYFQMRRRAWPHSGIFCLLDSSDHKRKVSEKYKIYSLWKYIILIYWFTITSENEIRMQYLIKKLLLHEIFYFYCHFWCAGDPVLILCNVGHYCVVNKISQNGVRLFGAFGNSIGLLLLAEINRHFIVTWELGV